MNNNNTSVFDCTLKHVDAALVGKRGTTCYTVIKFSTVYIWKKDK